MNSTNLPALKLRVSPQSHAIALQFSAPYPTEAKQQQVYANILAVSVVNGYLQQLDIPTDLEQSPGWQSHHHTLNDVADLSVPGWGNIACRPVLADEQSCYVPPGDQMACLAVQFDADFQNAVLVGFVEVFGLKARDISLTQFQDFNLLLDRIPEPATVVVKPTDTHPLDQLLRQFPELVDEQRLHSLGDWLQEKVASGWQSFETLWGSHSAHPVAVRAAVRSPVRTQAVIERCKVLNLGTTIDPVVLVVMVEPKVTQDVRVTMELWPIQSEQLPETLEFQLLDDVGIVVMQAQARGSNHLQFTFSVSPEDSFEIKVTFQDIHMIESFVI